MSSWQALTGGGGGGGGGGCSSAHEGKVRMQAGVCRQQCSNQAQAILHMGSGVGVMEAYRRRWGRWRGGRYVAIRLREDQSGIHIRDVH